MVNSMLSPMGLAFLRPAVSPFMMPCLPHVMMDILEF